MVTTNPQQTLRTSSLVPRESVGWGGVTVAFEIGEVSLVSGRSV